jgi:hypothetical protein
MDNLRFPYNSGGAGACNRCGAWSEGLKRITSDAMIGVVWVCPDCGEKAKSNDDGVANWVFSQLRRPG